MCTQCCVYILYIKSDVTKWILGYGVATISRILKNICLFAEYRSLL